MTEQTDSDLPKFASEIPKEKFKEIISLLEEDIIDLTQFKEGEILVEEYRGKEIIDISMANFWDSHFRRINLRTRKILYSSNDFMEGNQGLTPGSEALRGSLMGYCLGRKQLADSHKSPEEREKIHCLLFGD
jgi:hypothetical protein